MVAEDVDVGQALVVERLGPLSPLECGPAKGVAVPGIVAHHVAGEDSEVERALLLYKEVHLL